MEKKEDSKYYLISIQDVAELLPFVKKECDNLADEIEEENRIKQHLNRFKDILERHFGDSVAYIGEEKSYGKHLERFLFEHGGFMEIMLEPPLILKVHFLSQATAQRFAEALKKTMSEVIQNHPLKDMFIENITVEETEKDPIPIKTWAKMHHIYLQRSMVFTFVAIFIVAIFEIIKAVVGFLSLSWMGYISSFLISICGAVLIAFLFEPVKKRADKLVNRYLIK